MTKKDINKVWIESGTVRCDIFWFWFLNLFFLTHYSGKPVIISGLHFYECSDIYTHRKFTACLTLLLLSFCGLKVPELLLWEGRKVNYCQQVDVDTAASWQQLGVTSLMRHKWWICPDSLASCRYLDCESSVRIRSFSSRVKTSWR